MAFFKAFNSANLKLSALAIRLIEYGFDAANLSFWLSIGIPESNAIASRFYITIVTVNS
jgi:hypothetical protein